jgi:hypothetical protein
VRIWTAVIVLLPPLLTAACLPVPNSGEIEDVDIPFHEAAFLAPGERVAVLGGNDDAIGEDYAASCLREELRAADPPVPLLAASEVQDSLFPWFELSTRPETETEFAAFLARPGVSERLRALNLRHVLLVTSSTADGQTAGAEAVIAGVYGAKQRTSLSATVVDMKNAAMLGDAGVRAAATGGIAHVMLYGVILVPTTQSTACKGLARQLGAIFAGRAPPPVGPGPAAGPPRAAER